MPVPHSLIGTAAVSYREDEDDDDIDDDADTSDEDMRSEYEPDEDEASLRGDMDVPLSDVGKDLAVLSCLGVLSCNSICSCPMHCLHISILCYNRNTLGQHSSGVS